MLIIKQINILLLVILYGFIVTLCIWIYNEYNEMKIEALKTDIVHSMKDDSGDKTYMEQMENVMLKRKLKIFDHCNEDKKQMRLQYGVTRRLLINTDNNLTWCPICKSGSTMWMEVFARIGGELDSDVNLPDINIQISKLARKAHPYLGVLKVHQLLQNTKKFMIVRHPFERLLSAFRDKLEDESKLYYYNKYGQYIVNWYRMGSDNRTVPYFEEFLKYIVEEREFDEHWRPYYQECAPCYVKYDVIIKMENIQDEMEYLLNYLNNTEITQIIQKNKWKNINPFGRTDTDIIKNYFSNISTTLLQQIYDIYENDFILFDYDPYIYFNITHTDVTS